MKAPVVSCRPSTIRAPKPASRVRWRSQALGTLRHGAKEPSGSTPRVCTGLSIATLSARPAPAHHHKVRHTSAGRQGLIDSFSLMVIGPQGDSPRELQSCAGKLRPSMPFSTSCPIQTCLTPVHSGSKWFSYESSCKDHSSGHGLQQYSKLA